ncbi:phosphatidate cytidylyltransferase [Actinomyces sp. MRS3W]|uniref:phosphatidate cytidylyltransferase n=1 Tax=Actinomyces sp. MRS3W TaxID=2800796 RepID=UPI0028FD5E3D|nr:phosphatidate cytidylyltransferase [Actinomyces sp. MRS3W]MDU0349369.1 phosphatidate cytidylyltransferase [Actinomyces sp. MRS3W]
MSTLLTPPPTRNRAPLPATGRAGRNLPAAVGVAVLLIGVILASLVFNKVIFVGVVVVAVCGALWELAGAFARKGIRLPLAPLWLGTLGVAVCAWKVGAEAALGAYIATAGACVLWCFFDQAEAESGTVMEEAGHDVLRTEAHDAVRRSRSVNASASVFAATYLPFLASFAVLLAAQPQGVGKVLMLIALPVANDTGGWLAGITFGKHPLAPSVSPKKSWEGLVGSLIAAVGVGMLCLWTLEGPLWAGAVLGATVVCVSTLGDLGESLLKRDLGLKDMGTLLPGHGGLMDRLDSILVAAPVVYVFSLLAG